MKIKLYTLIMAFCFLCNLNAQINLPQGMVAYWPFDNNTVDMSGSQLNGTNINGSTFIDDRFDRIQSAIHFDGISQFVRCGDILDTFFCATPSATFTVSGWVKPDNLSANRSVVIGKSAGGTGPYQWYIYIDTDGKMVVALCSTPNGPADWVERKSSQILSTSKWNHFVFTFDGTLSIKNDRIQLYVDTLASAIFTTGGTMGRTTQNTAQELTIGASHNSGQPNSPANQFKGSIDNIRIHSRVLTHDEIIYLFKEVPEFNYSVNISQGLSAHWPLDSNVLDISGNNYHGTAMNNPSYTFDRSLKSNRSIHFDGLNQFARFGDILDSVFCKSPSSTFSVSGWLKPDHLPNARQVIIGKSAGGTGPYQWYVYIDNDGKIVVAVCSTPNGPGDWVEKKSIQVLSTSTWSHFTITFDGRASTKSNRVHLYVDTIRGSLFTIGGSMGTTTTNTAQEITIGASHNSGQHNSPANQFKGSLDDIRIHNRVLNPSEISYLFNEPININYTVNIPSGLCAYWPLDSNVLDFSGNKFHGTAINNPVYINDRASRANGGIHFDGLNQYARFGDILDTIFCKNPISTFSVSGWVKPDHLPNFRQVIIGKSAGGIGPYQWYMYIDFDGKLVIALCSTANGPSDWVEKKSTNTLDTSRWTHFVLTFDGGAITKTNRLQLYTDTIKGSLFTEGGNMGTKTVNTAQEITMGASHNSGQPTSPANQFKGSLDDVRIHNRLLNPAEISYLFKNVSDPAPVGLLELGQNLRHNLYPNPAINEFDIKLINSNGPSEIFIFNTNGQCLLNKAFSGELYHVDISSYPSGLYFVVLTNNESISKSKLIKK